MDLPRPAQIQPPIQPGIPPGMQPWRSVLYVPGSNLRALDKARTLPVDALILDLEDAVAVGEKPNARRLVRQAIEAGGFGNRAILVRINSLDTPWGQDDAAALHGLDLHGLDLHGVLLPKVRGADDISGLARLLPDARLWAMMETPLAVLNAAAVAGHPRLSGLVMGTNDLATELGCLARPDRLPLMTALQLCLLAARVHGRICIDGVFNTIDDPQALAAECRQGRDLGFDGKTLIHPAQIATANSVFAPDPADIALAQRQIEALTAAEAQGRGVAVVDGKIVENLHIVTARATLAKAARIAALEGAA